EHVLHEPHVTGDVDETHDFTRRKFGERESQVDRQPARLFFGKPVGIGTGQREDQRRLAVVDVTRGRYDPHCTAATRRASSAGAMVRRSQTTRPSSTRATMRACRNSSTFAPSIAT